jgi:hypothetical protein
MAVRILRPYWPWALIVLSAVTLLVALGLVLGAGTFGNVAEWAAALGTIAAFGATVLLLRQEVDARRREVADRERRQASLISCWLGQFDTETLTGQRLWHDGVFVKNASDEPIYQVVVEQEPGQREGARLAY